MNSLLDLTALKLLWKERRWGDPAWQAFEKGYFEELWPDYEHFEGLPEAVLSALQAEIPYFPLTLHTDALASDGTQKVLFETHDGLKFESVLMRYTAPGKPDRFTVCVSSQVGCPARCSFCATATMKWSRNLQADEIVAQVVYFNRMLKSQGARVNNVVFMGMGEPLLNYDEVKKALDLLLQQRKFNMGPRHITISTVGIVPGIERLLQDNVSVNLAVSLHAPNDTLRSQIVPVNKSYPLEKLFDALDRWTAQTGKKIFFEYVMLKDLNDQLEHVDQLGALLKNRLCSFNLIPYNPGPGLQELYPSKREQIYTFANALRDYGVHVLIRHTFGQDIDAACGQLVIKSA